MLHSHIQWYGNMHIEIGMKNSKYPMDTHTDEILDI